MERLNLWGTLLVVILLIPNILYGISVKNQEMQRFSNKYLETTEQIGRYGCMALMVYSLGARQPGGVYLILGGGILGLYILGWAVFWRENSMRKALCLSILPTLLFLESGLLTNSIPLVLLALLFGVGHITISVKSAL